MKRYAALLFLTLSSLLIAPVASPTPITLVASLTGANEVPPTGSPGIGTALVTLDAAANTLIVDVVFSGLLSPTIASHIHCCGAPGTNQMVATTTPFFVGFPIGVTSGIFHTVLDLLSASSYNPAFVTAHGGTVATAEAALIAGLLGGQTYLNIHTQQFTGGEIRGQLHVPEPATLALLAGGLMLLGVARRRGRR